MAKMKLSSITIEGMHNVDKRTYSLKQFNYLYGFNGAGKTTIMQAIQLSLLGYIPGTDKTKSAIFGHSNGPEMRVRLNIDDGGEGIEILRSWQKVNKDITTFVRVVPDTNIDDILQGLELPVCDFDQFVGMTANKLKDWFMWFLPASGDNINWDEVLSSTTKSYGKILDEDFVKEINKYTKDLPKGLEGIRIFNDYLKSQLSNKNAEVSRLQSTIQSLVFYDDCDDSLDSSNIEAEIKELEGKKDGIKAQLVLAEHNINIQREIEMLNLPSKSLEEDVEYIACKTKEKTIRKELDQIQPPDELELNKADIQLAIGKILEEVNDLKIARANKEGVYSQKEEIINSGGVCTYTNNKCNEIVSLIDELKKELVVLQKDIDRVNEDINSKCAEMESLNHEIDVIDDKLAKDMDRIRGLKEEANRNDACIAQLEAKYLKCTELRNRLDHNLNMDVDKLNSELEAIQLEVDYKHSLIVKIEANKRYNELTDTITKDKYRMEQNVSILKDWIKLTDVNGLQSRVMDEPFEGLEDKITCYLKRFLKNDRTFKDKDIKAKFNLLEKANSFGFGISIGDTYIPFDMISKGQRCLYTLSLLLSIVESGNVDMPLILVDDIIDHLDIHNVSAFFEVLYEEKNTQIVLAGIKECNHVNAKEFVIDIK